MRFIRRGGRDDELPVEHEDAPPADDAETVGDADGGPPSVAAENEGELVEAEADVVEAEPQAFDADDVGEPGEADAEPHHAEVVEAGEPVVNVDEAEPGGPSESIGEAEVGELGAKADDAGADDPEAEAFGVDDAPPEDTPPEDEAGADDNREHERGPFADDEGLSGLVAGGVAPAIPESPIAEDTGPDPLGAGRPAALRLAGLHLRTGQHALARAELEALAGRGRLDDEALLDLAEVRWRTGDLAGAGDTANVLLTRGRESTLALVIAAEAVAAAGRPMEARRLSSRALEVAEGPLDPLFAGMPRAMIWPVAAAAEPAGETPRRRSRRPRAEGDGAPTTASEAFAGGRAALARGDANRAGLLLGVAMRLEPAFAEDVLRAVTGRDDQPLLALVRGDALRLLGREAEALEAFDRARGRSAVAIARPDEALGPGLFDEDQG